MSCGAGIIRMAIEKGASDYINMAKDHIRPPTRREARAMPGIMAAVLISSGTYDKDALDRLLALSCGSSDVRSLGFYIDASERQYRLTLVRPAAYEHDGREHPYGYASISRVSPLGLDYEQTIAYVSVDDYLAVKNRNDEEALLEAYREGLRRMHLEALPPLDLEDIVYFHEDERIDAPETSDDEIIVCNYCGFWADYYRTDAFGPHDLCRPMGQTD